MITYFAGKSGQCLLIGLAADSKPANPPATWMFIETDTAKTYTGNGSAWVQVLNDSYADVSSLAAVALTGDYDDLINKPTLGTAAATAATDYATAAQGATADSALQPTGNGGNLTGLTKTQVGLSNVDNTSDASKPVSTATQTALDLKANLASPTFTGTVAGITAAMVGAPSGSGTSSGTNTGDNATNSQYSGLAASKQDALVSGTNIKTINGASVLGSGDLVVSAGDPSYSPGSFTVATETGKIVNKTVQLTTNQRMTIEGTGRLSVIT